ncbi:two-component transcriptional regulatory protein [Crocosphaera subtropica ATCC 51142]|uniref:Two-component transcriptional regulatory protein n=1 Tax=Crocosphaera subtropica (strain ATCC 51142 / BH68) TaxID=43989 RepID=B1WYQ8_CROS5|nr:response regulator transcription factor [Crocosphaera subtropica]ACB51075.1 two-component transcriptional regulatory protein [Crocosphaera subtropica ATCC 51142]
MKILIVEDEMEIAKIIQTTLERESFDCMVAYDGLTALDLFQQQAPDLIILDLMLPKLDGLEVCTRIRQKVNTKDPYILMLTAKGEEIDRVIGLSTGADDYLVKPFSPIELVARVRALLRRSLRHGGSQNNVYETPHFMVDLDKHSAVKKLEDNTEDTLELTTLEFNLLSTFMSYPGRVWSRTQLIDKLWGNDFFGDERVVDTHVRRLRKKIEPDTANPTFIKTVVGVGYKFEDETSS